MLLKLFAILVGLFIVLLPTWMQLISLLPLASSCFLPCFAEIYFIFLEEVNKVVDLTFSC